MASRPKGFGFTAELQKKKEEKYDQQLAKEAMEWIASYIDETLDCSGSRDTFHSQLKDGQRLCRLINALNPGAVPKINESKMAFKEMENIGNFLSSCEEYGVDKSELFQTVDLYEAQNIAVVVLAIHALGREASRKGHRGI